MRAGVDEKLVRMWERDERPLPLAALLILPTKVRAELYAALGRKLGVAA